MSMTVEEAKKWRDEAYKEFNENPSYLTRTTLENAERAFRFAMRKLRKLREAVDKSPKLTC